MFTGLCKPPRPPPTPRPNAPRSHFTGQDSERRLICSKQEIDVPKTVTTVATLSLATRELLVKDFVLPIPTVQSPYFEFFLQWYESLLGSQTLVDSIVEDMNKLGGEDAYNQQMKVLPRVAIPFCPALLPSSLPPSQSVRHTPTPAQLQAPNSGLCDGLSGLIDWERRLMSGRGAAWAVRRVRKQHQQQQQQQQHRTAVSPPFMRPAAHVPAPCSSLPLPQTGPLRLLVEWCVRGSRRRQSNKRVTPPSIGLGLHESKAQDTCARRLATKHIPTLTLSMRPSASPSVFVAVPCVPAVGHPSGTHQPLHQQLSGKSGHMAFLAE